MEDKGNPEIRCPRLGGPVYFKYCMTCGDGKSTCFKIFDCWWEHFDIFRYLKERLPRAEFQKLMADRPKAKVTSLIEFIEQAKRNRATGRP